MVGEEEVLSRKIKSKSVSFVFFVLIKKEV